MNGVARSLRLFRAFRHEQDDPARFYRLLSADAVAQVSRRCRPGIRVLDVGGGPGYLQDALEAAGSRCVTLDVDAAELSLHGRRPRGAVVGDGRRLPFGDGTFDVAHSSNVLEHVSDPWPMLDEMARVVVPGGLVFASFTNWLSPWGGHETSPWHYLGGESAARRFERRHGRPPKNRYGRSLFPLRIGAVLGWARSHPDLDAVDAFPRYFPRWARFLVKVPGLREVLTWNVSVVLRRRW